MLNARTITSLMLTGVLAGASLQALAVPATCQSLGIQNNVTHTDGCKLGTTNNDTIGSTNQVNTDQMFGFSDWVFGEKTSESGGNVDVGLTTYGNAQLGLWQIDDSVWDLYSDVMLVLQGGNGDTIPNTYVGYLLEEGEDWGAFLSPYMMGGRRQGISHLSIYLRGSNAVPEPTTLALIGIGLVGLAYMRRRRS